MVTARSSETMNGARQVGRFRNQALSLPAPVQAPIQAPQAPIRLHTRRLVVQADSAKDSRLRRQCVQSPPTPPSSTSAAALPLTDAAAAARSLSPGGGSKALAAASCIALNRF